MPMEEKEHKRRVRYKGKYPRRFEEKYKELDPDRYREDVEKIREKGKTPAGTHIPIMVSEILEVLNISPGETGYDATLGYGGHTTEMLRCLKGEGHIYATDVDPIESAKTEKRLSEAGFGPDILTVRHMNFADCDRVAPGKKFDFVLADLGVSSMQIDNPERGFTYKADGPLDLRLNPESGETAAERLQSLTEEELAGMLRENADEPYALEIAAEVRKTLRKGQKIETTVQLADIVRQALKGAHETQEDAVRKSCQRTFQALRIDVNSEFEVLYAFLDKLPEILAPGGRAAVLTFHSGEDRLVKKAFREGKRNGIYQEISEDAVRPSAGECYRNPRAHSTKLRWAVKSGK